MQRFTVSIDDELAEWVESQADERGVSKAKVIRDAVDAVSSGDTTPVQRGDTEVVQSGDTTPVSTGAASADALDQLRERVADLEARLDEHEELPHESESRSKMWGNSEPAGADSERQRNEPTSEAGAAESARAAAHERGDTAGGEAGEKTTASASGQRGREAGDDVEAALAGWSHGRDQRERTASRELAERALQWLRETPIGQVTRSDVPLEEWAAEDALDRTPDTIWTEVVRGAFQHAAGRGYVEQPHSRAYRWVGDGS